MRSTSVRPFVVRSALVTAILLCSWPAFGDEIILKDGTVVRGELVGFESGVYTVRIGRFDKKIPEASVSDVRSGPSGVSGTSTRATLVTSSTSARNTAKRVSPARPVAGPGDASVPGGTDPSPLPGRVEEILGKLGIDAGKADPQSVSSTAGLVEQIIGGKGRVDPAELEALKNNPFAEKLVERFADPNYQKSLLEGIQEMQEKVNPGQPNPMVDHLKGLFEQLNQLHRASEGAKPAATPVSR